MARKLLFRSGPRHRRRAALWASALASLIGGSCVGAAEPGPAAAPDRGRLLYENHCTECHTSTVHIRERRIGTSEQRVRATIERWARQLGVEWSQEEVDDVFAYLNRKYYRFGATQ